MPLPDNLKLWTTQALRQYNLWAGAKRGQHFLIDKDVLLSIVKAAGLKPTDKVLEVGGGLGILTLPLLEQAQAVVTVELEPSLVRALKKFLPTSPNLKVLAGDILKISDAEITASLDIQPGQTFKIVANLPYDISGVFLKRFLGTELPISDLTLLLQKEVAARLAASPGQMSLLSVLAQINGQAKIVRLVPPTSFFPPPKVDSVVLRFSRFNAATRNQLLAGLPEDQVWRWARVGFSARRKMLKNNLLSAAKISPSELSAIFKKVELDEKVRAQELSVKQWVDLAKLLS